jgi:Ras GTPase-activating-like protein IQGAP2/3
MEPVTEDHEMLWEEIVDNEMTTELQRQRNRRMASSRSPAILSNRFGRQSFRDMKAHAIFFLLELEKQGQVTRGDGYQYVLNAIASDVRSKHRRRIQRQQERDSMREALKHLKERRKQFEEQIKSYHDYVDQAMSTMQRSKG